MQSTRRFAALALVSTLLLGACTGGDGGSGDGGTGGLTGPQDTGPTPAASFTPGVGEFTYENAGLRVTADIEGATGTVAVDNGSDNDLDPLGLYVLDAVDGHEVEVQVQGSAPVAAGEEATFEIALDTDVDQIGLLILLFGKDNYGAFVRTG